MSRARLLGYLPVLLGVLALLWVIRSERHTGEQADTIHRAEQALASGKSFRVHLAKIQAVAQSQADSARRWKLRAVERGAALVRLDAQLAQMRTPAESLPVVIAQRDTAVQLAAFWQASSGRWELAYRADSTRATLAEQRVASLEAHLAATLTVADCRINLLLVHPRCPSRATTFVVGVVGGLALSKVLR